MKTPPPARSARRPGSLRRLRRLGLSLLLVAVLGAGCASSGGAASGDSSKSAKAGARTGAPASRTKPAKNAPATAGATSAKPAGPGKSAAKNADPKPADTADEASAVAAVVGGLAPKVEGRLRDLFARAGALYPPKSLALLAFKTERKLEIWAEGGASPVRVWIYPLLDSSPPGPKLEQGDWQIPEGVYRVTWLNPKSDYHLSIALDYPNDFDRAMAAADKRTDLGGDIFIHGKDTSIGCLAIGDAAVEELFVLVSRVGVGNVRVLISPDDLRSKPAPPPKVAVEWIDELYAVLKRELARYPLTPAPADAAAPGGR